MAEDQQPKPSVDELKPARFWRVRRFGRAISYALRTHSGPVVTVAGTVAGSGGVLVAIGLVQISTDDTGPVQSPWENGWVRVGLVLLFIGVALSVSVLLVLIVRRIRDENRRVRLVARTNHGRILWERLTQNPLVDEDKIKKWDQDTSALLALIDPMLGLWTRYLNDVGLSTTPPDQILTEEQLKWDRFLQKRLMRLNEFIAELER